MLGILGMPVIISSNRVLLVGLMKTDVIGPAVRSTLHS